MYRIFYELEHLNANFENGKLHPLSRDKFKFLKLIGAGGFGKVYQVYSTFSKNHYAMKVLSKNQIKHYSLQKQLKREIDILDKCRHEFIVKLYACFEDTRYTPLPGALESPSKSFGIFKLRSEDFLISVWLFLNFPVFSYWKILGTEPN